MKYVSFAIITMVLSIAQIGHTRTCDNYFGMLARYTDQSIELIASGVVGTARNMVATVDQLEPLNEHLSTREFQFSVGVRFDHFADSLRLLSLSLEEIIQIRSSIQVTVSGSSVIPDNDLIRQKTLLKEVDTLLLEEALDDSPGYRNSRVGPFIVDNMSGGLLREQAMWALSVLNQDLAEINNVLYDYIRFVYFLVFKEELHFQKPLYQAISEIKEKLRVGRVDSRLFIPNANHIDADASQLTLINLRQRLNRIVLRSSI